jgi:riboflavin biosynthesis pyrimidine reductase
MQRPYVICHMGSTINGRIIVDHWGENQRAFSELYETCHKSFDSQAWIVGRVTMEQDFTEGLPPLLPQTPEPLDREPFVGDNEASSFAIAVDPEGKLGWEENEIEGDHVIVILLESVADGYLHYLRERRISYVFAGNTEVDLTLALAKLHILFNIRTLMLEGGGHLNGSFLAAGLVDQLSLLLLPLADGTSGTPTTFEFGDRLPGGTASALKLQDVTRMDYDVIWLTYKVS